MEHRRTLTLGRLLALVVLLSLALAAGSALALAPDEPEDSLGLAAFSVPALHVEPSLEMVPANARLRDPELGAFFAEHTDRWEMRWDQRNDRPHLLQGAGVPLLPGRGNDLTAASLGLRAGAEPTLADVETAVRGFLRRYDVLRAAEFDLVLDEDSSAVSGLERHFWNVELQQVHAGVPVHGAGVFFRISHGNIVQFGADKLAPVHISTTPSIRRDEAFGLAFDSVQLAYDRHELLDEELVLYPAMGRSEQRGELYTGAPGTGYEHRLVWRFTFTLDAGDHEYQSLVDAHTGEVLEFIDLTMYADVQADIYPITNTDPLETVRLPYVSVDVNGTEVITDANGSYSYTGGTATVALDGRYINIDDQCGSISLSDASSGDIDFGGSSGTDCTTPGYGGDGNTHSARTGYYHLTNINRKAATFLPTNSWLDGTLTARMNINNTCNAFWGGSRVNFYRSGSNCANTGEIAAVFLHEWGHGMDSNAGGAPPEKGSGEALADTFAFLETKNACIGDNFYLGSSCHNCNSDCSGVRDIASFAQGGTSTIAHPTTVESNSGINCDRWSCPYYRSNGSAYQGPMGYQGHCESYIASTATWDLAQSLVDSYGSNDGWATMDDIWYSTLYSTESAYRVASGGQCNPSASVDGCAASNWYTVFLAADDDDGDLSNGTPNGCRIWDAFDAHGIACGSRPACYPVAPEFGSATTDERTRTVSITGFDDPIVMMGAPSYNGTDPATMQVKNVSSSSFQHQVVEWNYLDGSHNNETAGYLVVEAGSSTFAGLQVDAGSTTAKTGAWKTISFDQSFSSTPVVLAVVASGGKPFAVRVRNVGTSSFQVRLQTEELFDNLPLPFPFVFSERVHWIALERGTGTYDGQPVLVGSTGNAVTESWYDISFGGSYSNPIWLGSAMTYDGSDPAVVRYRSLSSTGVQVKIEEEKSADSETDHNTEEIGFVVIGGN
ncbi:MAG: H-type lectin domain-containing protein [Acidobacteriota bacterium]